MFMLVEENNGVFSYSLFTSKDMLHNVVLQNLSILVSDDERRQDQIIQRIAPMVLADDYDNVNLALDEEDEQYSVFWDSVTNGHGSITHVLVRFYNEEDLSAEPLIVGSEDRLWQEALEKFREAWPANKGIYFWGREDPEVIQRALAVGNLEAILRLWSSEWDRWEVHPITRIVG